MYIDTHAHLQLDDIKADRESVIQRAIKHRLDAILTIGVDAASSRQAIDLAEKFAIVFAAVGIHPNDAADAGKEDFAGIVKLAGAEKVIAIGEVGLDYYRLYTPKEKQEEALRSQIGIARDLKLPLIIHNREANEDILNILNEENADDVGGVFHSFSGDMGFLESVLAKNYHVSFTGPVTFKNVNYNKLIESVPLEQLLLETDSPFLAPVPFRGKRNEPAYVRYIAEKIAQIKGISPEKLAQATSSNAKSLFQLKDV
jgi:TatD DNase family protein